MNQPEPPFFDGGRGRPEEDWSDGSAALAWFSVAVLAALFIVSVAAGVAG